MSSKILSSSVVTVSNKSPSLVVGSHNGTSNGSMMGETLFSTAAVKAIQKQSQLGIYENNHYQNNSLETPKKIVYDAPKSSECIIYESNNKSNGASPVSVDNLIPQAARLILSNNAPKSRSDFVDQERSDSDDYDYVVTDDTDSESEPNIPAPDYEFNYTDDFRDRDSYGEYGLEVIQEETESQMSSDSDQELEQFNEYEYNLEHHHSTSGLHRKMSGGEFSNPEIHFGLTDSFRNSNDILSYDHHHTKDEEDSPDNKNGTGEIVTKHLRISAKDFDPDPILQRLYHVAEPQKVCASDSNETVAGYMNILSGNRKKGTFWNAWRKKFYVVSAGKLNGYEKDDCQELFQSINLIGGKVDFLDPIEFVGPEQGKIMTNRIIGVDDGKGHYFVLQCSTPEVAVRWVACLQHQMALSLSFAVPILSKTPSLFRDIVLVDIGSSSVRAGVLTHQPTLPALFFGSVMSENLSTGMRIYGNDAYKPENRKNAKITFPFESTSKMCQNTIEIDALEGFLRKIFKDLNIRPENYRLILNLPRRVENKSRKNILELVFNMFQVRSVMIAHQSVVAFWAYSTDNGIVCDVGERCDIVPVSQGFILSQAWTRAPYGGHPLKHSLRQGLGPQENGLYLSTPAENLVLRFISENFVCINSNGSRRPSQDSQEIVVEMDLRDILSFGNLIGVNQNVLRGVGEGFFDPSLYGFDCDSLPKMIFKCLQNCGVDIRKEMSQNILLVGGCTLIPGFPERLEHELSKLCPPHLKPKINVSPYRYHASFIGSSVLATTEAFEKSLLHRSKYDGGSGPAYWMI